MSGRVLVRFVPLAVRCRHCGQEIAVKAPEGELPLAEILESLEKQAEEVHTCAQAKETA